MGCDGGVGDGGGGGGCGLVAASEGLTHYSTHCFKVTKVWMLHGVQVDLSENNGWVMLIFISLCIRMVEVRLV